MSHILHLDCGHTRDIARLLDIGVGHVRYCPTCGTDKLITAIMPHDTSRYRTRPVNDALLDVCMFMIREALRINMTGDTFEGIESRARRRLYDKLDMIAGGPPVDYEAKYKELLTKCQKLAELIKPPAPGHMGLDYNTLVSLINELVKT